MRLLIMVGVIGLMTAPGSALLAGENSPAEKAAADWLYPGAKVVSSAQGGEVSGVLQETPDDVPKILKYYGDKLGIKLNEATALSGATFNGGVTLEYAHVGLKSGAAGGTATVSTFKTKTAVATLVVSRSPDAKVSSVAITHVPQNAIK